MSDPTPETVARLATQAADLPRRGLALLGTFGTEAAPRALVRLGRRDRVTVSPGAPLDGGRVEAIGIGELVLVRGGVAEVLRLPEAG
jgi:hypothetical protein